MERNQAERLIAAIERIADAMECKPEPITYESNESTLPLTEDDKRRVQEALAELRREGRL